MEKEIRERLRKYREAEEAILRGQSYKIGDRELRRADLSAIRSGIESLQQELKQVLLKNGRRKRVVFI